MKQLLKRFWFIWTLFFFSNGLLPLVNTIEGSFARTLVSCALPVSHEPGALFSGSARCGDRLLVINEGQFLSSVASSHEGAAKIAMMLAVAALTDAYGRKPMLIFGISCTAVSILLFILACVVDPWAQNLFILGQGLQGAYPVELLFQQVAADLASMQGVDRMGVFEIQGLVKFLPVVVFGFVASSIQTLELTSYLWLWCAVLLATLGLLALAALAFPETRPGPGTPGGVCAGMRHELREYRELFTETGGVGRVQYILAYVFIDAMSRAKFPTLVMSLSMSYYSMTATQVIVYALPIVIVHTLSTPLVGWACKLLGTKGGFVAVCAYKAVAGCLFVLQPFSPWAWFAQYYLSSLASGWDALTSAMNMSVFEHRTSKYMALATLCNYGSGAVAAPMYAALFDAKATTYLARLRPGLVSFALYAAGMVIVFLPATKVWPTFCRGLDRMQDGKKED